MKIGDVKDSAPQMIRQYQRNDNLNQTADKQAGVSSVKGEKVDLSARAKNIQQIKDTVAALPEMREDKIQELKAQVDKGSYKINSTKIAENMIRESIIDLFA